MTPGAQTILEKECGAIADSLGEVALPLAGRRVLVTGATGLLGGGLASFFLALFARKPFAPARVMLYGRDGERLRRRFEAYVNNPQVELLSGPLLDLKLPDLSPDLILHAACPASPKDYIPAGPSVEAMNISATGKFLEYLRAKGEGTLLFVSSADVYGDPPPEKIPTPETFVGRIDPTSPRATYALTKLAAEGLCREYHRDFGVDSRIVRPFNIYGPGQRVDDGRLIADFVRRGIDGQAIALHSDGTPRRAFCYLQDAVEGTLRALLQGTPAEPYNIGNDLEELRVHELAETASRIMGLAAPSLVPPPSYQRGSLSRCCPDLSRAKNRLGFYPKINFAEGFRRTWECNRPN